MFTNGEALRKNAVHATDKVRRKTNGVSIESNSKVSNSGITSTPISQMI